MSVRSVKKGKLHLLPMPVGEDLSYIPKKVREQTLEFRYFIAERSRTLRRYLKRLDRTVDIDALNIFEMDKHTERVDSSFLEACLEGYDVALFSEAGMPCIADPGYRYVALAHAMGIEVKVHSGPNSILLALVASGFSGQHFEFHGYAPKSGQELHLFLKRIERESMRRGKTQVFMERPYRNISLVEQMGSVLFRDTQVVIASGLNTALQRIYRLRAGEIKGRDWSLLHKQPSVFLLGV